MNLKFSTSSSHRWGCNLITRCRLTWLIISSHSMAITENKQKRNKRREREKGANKIRWYSTKALFSFLQLTQHKLSPPINIYGESTDKLYLPPMTSFLNLCTWLLHKLLYLKPGGETLNLTMSEWESIIQCVTYVQQWFRVYNKNGLNG